MALRVKVKHDVLFSDFQQVNPKLLIVLGHFLWFCEDNKLPCLVSSARDHVKGRVSKTHEQGRAFDASVRGFTSEQITSCLQYMEMMTGSLGAYSKKDGKQRVVVFHVGTAAHLHFQVHP